MLSCFRAKPDDYWDDIFADFGTARKYLKSRLEERLDEESSRKRYDYLFHNPEIQSIQIAMIIIERIYKIDSIVLLSFRSLSNLTQ